MKKIIALLLALMMVFALAACAGNPDDNNNSGENGNSETNGKAEFRLPENVKYCYKSVNGDYQDLTVTKIGNEFCLEISGQITFYRKNADGTYDYWLRSEDSWMKMPTTFEEELFFSTLLGISTANFDYESVEKIGTDTVCGLSADVYKSKYLQNNQTYIHSGSDGEFIVKYTVGSTEVEITEWITENVEFSVEKPE